MQALVRSFVRQSAPLLVSESWARRPMTQDTDCSSSRTARAVSEALEEIRCFCESRPVRLLLGELEALPEPDRAAFVLDVLLDPNELRERNVETPDGLTIQRSAFRDNRPTLFCVVKYLPRDLLWDKVTITYDNTTGQAALDYQSILEASASSSPTPVVPVSTIG